jgi:hypothetical protein
MALESWMYGNPETVLMRKQEAALRKERACGQCVHKISIVMGNETVSTCEYKRKQYGKRCDLYAQISTPKRTI